MARKILWAVVSVLGAVLVVAALRVFVSATRRSGVAGEGSSLPTPIEALSIRTPSPLSVSAADLYAAYDLNAVAANDEYSGRKLDVTGVISSKRTDRDGRVHLHMRADQNGEYVDVLLGGTYGMTSMRLREGDAVTVQCGQVQRSLGSLALSECKPVTSEPDSTGE